MINLISTAEAAIILFAFRRFSVLNERRKKVILNTVCAALLGFNICRYATQSILSGMIRIPVEFSAVSYFLVPLIVLLKAPKLKVWAAYSGILAGSGYFLSIAVFGDIVYADYKTSSIIYALCCHGALLLIGLIVVSEDKFTPASGWVITLGLVYVSIHALLLRNRFGGGNGIFIYELLFAFRPIKIFGGGILPVYYLLLFALLILSFNLFYKLNLKLIKK